MSNCDRLIDECIPGDAKKCKWKYAIVMYNAAMKILQKKSNYTVDKIKKFQLLVDHSYLTFHSIYGKDIATKYWHMLSSGHIMWFMNCWGNLYRYSNQGWEALNQLMKSFIN